MNTRVGNYYSIGKETETVTPFGMSFWNTFDPCSVAKRQASRLLGGWKIL